jgi:hypothetical protein
MEIQFNVVEDRLAATVKEYPAFTVPSTSPLVVDR